MTRMHRLQPNSALVTDAYAPASLLPQRAKTGTLACSITVPYPGFEYYWVKLFCERRDAC